MNIRYGWTGNVGNLIFLYLWCPVMSGRRRACLVNTNPKASLQPCDNSLLLTAVKSSTICLYRIDRYCGQCKSIYWDRVIGFGREGGGVIDCKDHNHIFCVGQAHICHKYISSCQKPALTLTNSEQIVLTCRGQMLTKIYVTVYPDAFRLLHSISCSLSNIQRSCSFLFDVISHFLGRGGVVVEFQLAFIYVEINKGFLSFVRS